MIAGAILAAGLSTPTFAMRCGSKIVSVGDRKIEVVARCGEPSWKEERAEETEERVFRSGEHKSLLDERSVVTTIEEWVYNFGPTQLLYFLRFRNGVLSDIETGGYGYTEGRPADPGVQCTSESLAKGRRKVEVIRYCGEPASVDVREEERARTVFDKRSKRTTELRKTVTVEEWTYNFGPNRLLYVFTFENGKVVDVKTLGYGF